MLTAGLTIPTVISSASAGTREVLAVAHRGASGYAPENTIAAFDKAVEMKADFIELDVQLSKDGELAIIHDTTVDRTTDGTGAVKDLTFEQLRSLDAGTWFSPAYAGERIPTLGEVLDRYRGKIGILIEIKAPWLYPGIERKVADELVKRQMDVPNNGKIMIQSFDHGSVQRFHAILPDIPVGVLTYLPEQLTEAKLREYAAYADYVNPSLNLVTEQLVDQVHSLGMEIHAWTVRNAALVEPLIESGVDGIITDYPDYVPRNAKSGK
ncbi:glycerophosphodiester phosphodiesterase family protein [Cohnella sp. CFH 77786]|uniref:glycerophosphodiester phosphodiesterase n=1 Tax=Cohnella sp. CFH 77786 TaxID=2662265 RepID=UPI002107D575|nr:glycerophosphodiester phosphodiesterase family protein [Cohnella sp. CFH 77786]